MIIHLPKNIKFSLSTISLTSLIPACNNALCKTATINQITTMLATLKMSYSSLSLLWYCWDKKQADLSAKKKRSADKFDSLDPSYCQFLIKLYVNCNIPL